MPQTPSKHCNKVSPHSWGGFINKSILSIELMLGPTSQIPTSKFFTPLLIARMWETTVRGRSKTQ